MDAIEERTATLRTGLAVPYVEIGRGGSTPVVLVHAYVESWRYFEPVLRSLPPSIHAFVPTQRGHQSVVGGGSDSYRVSDFASDIVDFMDAVGIARAVLVGASSGGLVSQVVATTNPQRLAGLVLISSPVTLADKPAVTAMREEVMALSDPLDARFVEEFVRGTSPSAMPEQLVSRLVEESLAIPAKVWRESFLGLLQAERPERWRTSTCRRCCCPEAKTTSSAMTSRSCSTGSLTPSSWSTTALATVPISHTQSA